MNTRIEIIDYHPRYTDQTVMMWRTSKERALGIPETHDVEQHRYYLNRILVATNRVYIAVDKPGQRVVGMIAFDDAFITQLYVDPEYQHIGIGSALVELAKDTAQYRLQVFTVEMNHAARLFWKKHGFREKAVSPQRNAEGLTDLLCEWQRDKELMNLRFATV